jgi:hypothetical protein
VVRSPSARTVPQVARVDAPAASESKTARRACSPSGPISLSSFRARRQLRPARRGVSQPSMTARMYCPVPPTSRAGAFGANSRSPGALLIGTAPGSRCHPADDVDQ